MQEQDQLEQALKDDKDKESSAAEEEIISDPVLFDDLLKARKELKSKRDEFLSQIDQSLPEEDRNQIMNRYDEQM
jgi:hypothetical protein